MIKKILSHLLFLIPLIIVPLSHALDPFIKEPSSPLPFVNTFSGWNELGQYQPAVLYENALFKMWYASYNGSGFKIIYSSSSDGINWTRQNLLNVYPGFDNHDPAILKTPDGYTLFFVASTNVGSQNFKIYKIYSTDGVNFDPNSLQLVLQPATPLETNGISSPSVTYEDGNYYLFYLCWGPQGFRVCMATSSDGNNWQRCSNNPIISEAADGPSIFNKDGKYYIFFHSPLGLRQAESNDNLSCTMTWTNFKSALSDPGLSPGLTEKNNLIYFYYSGFYPQGLRINLATSGTQITPTPTYIATPTPTYIPSPTPTAVTKKIIIVPGLFSSWNSLAMLHNLEVPYSNWKKLNFVKEYDGLISTLENLNYHQNEDYFIFNYDWRKNIENIAADFNKLISDKGLSNKHINLVGHSLGGLISRFYLQKYSPQNIEKIITVGSPHQGSANTYKLVEAGEIDRQDNMIWLMEKLLIHSQRKDFATDKDVISSLMPVSKDLFPIYDFLKDKNGLNISIQDMSIKNLNLLTYKQNFTEIFPLLTTYTGVKGDHTLYGYRINDRTKLDILLNNYPDGKPTSSINDLGDTVVSNLSSQAGNNSLVILGDHGEIIYKKDSIDSILTTLGITHSPNQIIEGEGTKITPSLVFALFSPATMQVKKMSQRFDEEDGLIFIPDAQSGIYNLKLKGQFPGGEYKVLVGQISDTDDKWFEINGKINTFLPFLQTDEYEINFSPDNLQNFPINEDDTASLFDLLIKKLQLIVINYENKYLQNAVDKTYSAKREYLRENLSSLSLIKEIENEVFKARINAQLTSNNELYDSLTQIENLYQRVAEEFSYTPTPTDLQKRLSNLNNQYFDLEDYLLNLKIKKVNVFDRAISLSLLSKKLEEAKETFSENNASLTDILLLSAENLSQEVR